jgi:hypothetical protein
LALAILAPAAHAAVIFEVYNNTAAFDSRLGFAPRVVNFDDLDTSETDPLPFPSNQYKYSHGLLIEGEDGQFASSTFDPGSNMPPTSLPNEYAPGPESDVTGQGGNVTDFKFFDGVVPGVVAGFGVFFIDPDNPGDGPSSFSLFGASNNLLTSSGTVSGGDGSQIFRGIIAIDDGTNQPTAVIARANVITGDGWAGNPDNEAVALDDVRFPQPQTPAGNMGEEDDLCYNCVDDDGDGLIDRADTGCFGVAVGPDGGLGDPDAGKPVTKCQKGNQKAGAKFVAAKLKHFHKCLQAVAKCVHTKNGDQTCLDKAGDKCGKELDKIAADEEKLKGQVVKACGPADIFDLENQNGMGYNQEVKPCAEFGVFGFDNAAEIGDCMVVQHECLAERLVGQSVPRAREYLTLAGRVPAVEFPCLPAGADGGGQGIGNPDDAKAILACDKAVQKGSIGLLKEIFKPAHKCADGLAACLQLKPGDAKCLMKAEEKCLKGVDKLTDEEKGKFVKLLTKVGDKCADASFLALGLPQGLGYGAMTTLDRCNDLGFSGTNPISLLSCLGADHLCHAFRMGEKQNPRLREFADRLGIDLFELIQ